MGSPITIPNMNPTGVIGSGSGNTMPGQSGTGFSSFGTGGPGNMGFGNSANPVPSQTSTSGANPFISSATSATQFEPAAIGTNNLVGNPGMQIGGVKDSNAVPTSNNPFGETSGNLYYLDKYLAKTYGAAAPLIYQYLMSQGGYNSAVTQKTIDTQTNAMQGQTQLGANNLESRLSAMGVSGSSSSMGDALSSFEGEAVTQQNAITAQDYYNMWNSSQDRYLSELQGVSHDLGVQKANSSSWMDWLTGGASLSSAIDGGTKYGASSGGSSSGSSSGISPEGLSSMMMMAIDGGA